MKLDEFWKEIQTKPIEAYVVTLRYKYDFETDYTVENEILEVEMSKYPNHYVWLSDWDEGQTDIEVVSYIAVSDVNTGNKPEPHWIPCSEKLPEVNKTVLATHGYNIFFARLDNNRNWEWLFEQGFDYWHKIDAPIIAWMPLPEPYKESKNEAD